MPRLHGVYEWRFVAENYSNPSGQAWEHVGIVVMNDLAEEERLAKLVAHERANMIRELTQQKIEHVAAWIDEIHRKYDQYATQCTAAGHLMAIGSSEVGYSRPCESMPRYSGLPWCRWREMQAKAATRAPERPMLVRVTIYPEVKE